MFKFMSVIFAGALLIAINNPAHAQTQEETIMEIIEATQMLDQFKDMQDMMPQFMEQQMASSGTQVSADMIQVIREFSNKLFAEMESELVPMTIRLYQNNFTQEELEDLLAFYRSETGQKLIEKTPEMMQQVMNETNTLMMSKMPQMQQEMMQRFEELQENSTN